ncbi:MAG: hypothetical protein ACI8QC_003769 [Planctomycetota bacterium]|jgi:hypothetical protein
MLWRPSCLWDPRSTRCGMSILGCYARQSMKPLRPTRREQARSGSGLLLLTILLGCGPQPPRPGQLALFDFEQDGWTAKSKRTDKNVHAGLWCGLLDVGTQSGNTLSPLVECEPGDRLMIEWQARFKLNGSERISLLIHGYGETSLKHTAIPMLPTKLGTRALHGWKESPSGWQPGTVTIDLDQVHPDAQWIRLEWRVVVPTDMRRKQPAARFYFDDVSITRLGPG